MAAPESSLEGRPPAAGLPRPGIFLPAGPHPSYLPLPGAYPRDLPKRAAPPAPRLPSPPEGSAESSVWNALSIPPPPLPLPCGPHLPPPGPVPQVPAHHFPTQAQDSGLVALVWRMGQELPRVPYHPGGQGRREEGCSQPREGLRQGPAHKPLAQGGSAGSSIPPSHDPTNPEPPSPSPPHSNAPLAGFWKLLNQGLMLSWWSPWRRGHLESMVSMVNHVSMVSLYRWCGDRQGSIRWFCVLTLSLLRIPSEPIAWAQPLWAPFPGLWPHKW